MLIINLWEQITSLSLPAPDELLDDFCVIAKKVVEKSMVQYKEVIEDVCESDDLIEQSMITENSESESNRR